MRTSIRLLATSLCVSAVALLGFSPPASAYSTGTSCYSGTGCLNYPNGSGSFNYFAIDFLCSENTLWVAYVSGSLTTSQLRNRQGGCSVTIGTTVVVGRYVRTRYLAGWQGQLNCRQLRYDNRLWVNVPSPQPIQNEISAGYSLISLGCPSI